VAPVRVPHTHAHRHLRTVEGPPPKEVSCQTMLASEAVLLVRAQVGTTRTRFWFLRCLPIGAYYNLCILGTCQLSGVDPCNYPNLHQSAFLFFVISRRPFRTSCSVTTSTTRATTFSVAGRILGFSSPRSSVSPLS